MLKCISKMVSKMYVSKKWKVKVIYCFSVYILKIKKKTVGADRTG